MRSVRTVLPAALAVLFLGAGSVPATTVERQSLDSLALRSELVVRGTVQSVQGFAEIGGHPYRIATLRVTKALAGASPSTVALRLPGGVGASGETTVVAGVPDLAAGDDLVVFLSRVPVEATGKAFVPSAAPDLAHRGKAMPAAVPPPVDQWCPLSLAVGTYRVVQVDGVETAVRDSESAGLRQVAPPDVVVGEAAPARAPLADLVAEIAKRRAPGSRR